ncbi:unnamed protein product [Closterium sp. NIES-64]|nr:unnamed protein product [Closterium sp. NIES-64]
MDEYRLEVETGSDLAALVLCRVFIKGNVAPPNAPRNPPSFAPASPNVSAATVSRPMSPAPSLTLGAFAEHVTMAKGQIVTDDYDTVNSLIQAKKMSAPGAAASAAAMGGGDAERFVDLLLAKDEVESGTTGGDNHGCADDERLLLNTMMDAIIIDDGDRSDKSGSDDVTASVQLVSEAFVDSSVEDSGRFVSGNGASAMDAEGSGQFGGFQSQHGSTTDLPGACNGNSSMEFEKLTSASYENISMAESQCAPAAAGTWKVPRSPRMVSTDTVGPNAGVNTGVNGGATGGATGGAIGGAAAAAVATPSLASGFSAADLEQPMYLQGDDDVTIKGFTPKAFTPMGFTPKGATPKGGSGYPFATPKAFSPGVGLWRFPSMTRNGKKRPAVTPRSESRLAEDRFVRVKQ